MSVNLRPDEISGIIKNQIKTYENKTREAETGTVITCGDGIVRAFGLDNCMANELVKFENGKYGMAMNLEEQTVSIIMLDDTEEIREGTRVRRSPPGRAEAKIENFFSWVMVCLVNKIVVLQVCF